MMQLYKMELKIAAGARFLITQVGFNVRKLYELRQYMLRERPGAHSRCWRTSTSRPPRSHG